jgi:hypothetical protein
MRYTELPNWGDPMLAKELVVLAGTSAATLVAAMTTDAWQSARSAVARVFGRSGELRQSAVEVQLDRHAELVAQAADPDDARLGLVGVWQLELEALLDRHPEAADDLRALLAQIQAEMPPKLQAWVQTNIARDSGTVFAVQGGNLVMYGASAQPTVSAGNGDTIGTDDVG